MCLYDIPVGRVATYADIGLALDVPSRHVAYIISQLDDEEKLLVPWYRAVGKDGVISKTNKTRHDHQVDQLRQEDIGVISGKVIDFPTVMLTPKTPKQALGKRPDDAPVLRAKKR